MNRVVLGLTLLMAACGSDQSPTSPAPEIAQVAGTWNYTARWSRVTGGSCVGDFLMTGVERIDTGSVEVTQVGTSLDATVRGTSPVLQRVPEMACQYLGSVNNASVALTAPACPAFTIPFRCMNGVITEVTLTGGTLNATVKGDVMEGTQAETYNANTAPTTIGGGPFTVTRSFSATRR